MKLALAAAALIGSATAFAPTSGARPSSALKMSAVADETYTFTKSEEIFKEAQDVRSLVLVVCGLLLLFL